MSEVGVLTPDAMADVPVPAQRHLPAHFVEEMQALERELDTLAPGWQRPGGGHVKVAPFGSMPPGPRKTRLQWVLKRHQHLLRGVDWTIQALPRGNGGDVVMVSVMDTPHVRGVSWEPPKLVDARVVGASSVGAPHKPVTPLSIALETRIPLHVVEAAEARRPADSDPLTWARAWFAARRPQ